jgi:hypothetical protein
MDVEDWDGKQGKLPFQAYGAYTLTSTFALVSFSTLSPTSTIHGFPLRRLSDLPPTGTFYVQAVLNTYETFKRSDSHVVKLHPGDKGEGQHWFSSPGNIYSTTKKIVLENGKLLEGGKIDTNVDIEMGEVIPEIQEKDYNNVEGELGKYIRQVKIKSELLSKFWGRDMYLSAMILLPHVSVVTYLHQFCAVILTYVLRFLLFC